MTKKVYKGWIGVDLDGTLAHYEKWRGVSHIGKPIERMLGRVKQWIKDDYYEVRIYTARVGGDNEHTNLEAQFYIHRWCLRNGLPALEVTNRKDMGMIECWDDRAIQVVPNTGKRADGSDNL